MMTPRSSRILAFAVLAFAAVCPPLISPLYADPSPDRIFHHGRIVTVDRQFRVVEALAVSGDRIVAVGSNEEVLATADEHTEKVDLHGRMVLPGFIDSHSHPPPASVFEFDHEIPAMNSIDDVLAYIAARAQVVPPGKWIVVQQVFVTRLKERRFPTREELDRAAPQHPVMFRTGPDAALNSLALTACGIDRDFQITDGGPGFIERDPSTGEPTGILRSCTRLVKVSKADRTPSTDERREALRNLLRAYNEVGITGVTDRGTTDASLELYGRLLERGELTCRMFLTYSVNAQQPMEKIEAAIARATQHPLHQYNPWAWLRGLKIYLDGGMLTGSAYMLRPWGVSEIYGITDPEYRGVIFLDPDKLYQIAKAALSHNLQLTAHAVGDGAVLALAEAYARVDREFPVRPHRPCISHANFMSPEAIALMAQHGIVADLQPAWLYLDGATLQLHFGEERLRYFQPYATLFAEGVTVGGGSDHMQKLGRTRSINTYDPWLGIWTILTRLPRWTDSPIHPEERINREQAIRLYTINNAFLTFEEDKKGSLEAGKYADFIIIDRDVLECPIDDIRDTRVLETWVGGKRVYP